MKIKKYFTDNYQLIIAIIISAIVLIYAISGSSALNGKKQTNKKSSSSKESSISENETTLSDLEFTLPEDASEETATTLESGDYVYMIKVNRIANCVTVYRQDENGNFTIPYKAMACSCGKEIENTPLGNFKISSTYNWRLMVDDTYSQYASRIYNGILFHSVPCFTANSNDLEYKEFNKLGTSASLGCVRLTVADSKWIYDNCPYGTKVEIYDDKSNPGPLGKPEVIKIPDDSPNKGWDPTDPDPNNPWNLCEPSIESSDITVPLGYKLDLMSVVKATDTCGNDISSNVKITGTVDTKVSGTYQIRYSVTDLLNRSASLDIKVKVVKSSSKKLIESEKKYSAKSGTMPATEAFPNEFGKKNKHNNNTTESYTRKQVQETTVPATTVETTTQAPTTTQPVTAAPTTTQPVTQPVTQPSTKETVPVTAAPTTTQASTSSAPTEKVETSTTAASSTTSNDNLPQ